MTPRARPRPTLRQLEYLVALAQALSFRVAAQRCHVSQPALSEQIRLLEEQLGVRLFERDKRRVALTAAGAHVLERARAVLGDVDDLVDAALGQGGPLAGPLALGAIPTVAPYVLPGLLAAVREAHPRLRLQLREAQTSVLVEELRAGRLDAAVLALPVEAPGLTALELFDDPFLLAAPAGHRLDRPGKARLSDLRREEVLLLEDGHCLREQALELCREAGAEELGDVRATSLRTLVGLVGAGLGVTLLPAIARGELGADGESGAGAAAGAAVRAAARGRGAAHRVVLRAFRDPQPRRTIGLVWRAVSARSGDFLLLGETLRRSAPERGLVRDRAARAGDFTR